MYNLHEYINKQILYFDRAIERLIEQYEIDNDLDGFKRCIKFELKEAYRKGYQEAATKT